MKRVWEIFDSLAREHWRLSDKAKLAGDDGGHGAHMQLAQTYDETAGVLRIVARDEAADPAIIATALRQNTPPGRLLTEMGLPAAYVRASSVEGSRA